MYITVQEASQKWGISDRRIRTLCKEGKVLGATLSSRTWKIPTDAVKPEDGRYKNRAKNIIDSPLLIELIKQKQSKLSGGIYHKLQIEMTYNSNHIEGSKLTQDQTRYIFETNTIGLDNQVVNVDDVVETMNHFRCIDLVIDKASDVITEELIKQLHFILKSGTSDARNEWFNVGEYKSKPNEVGGCETTPPKLVGEALQKLIKGYNEKEIITIDDIIDFHYVFEKIHPFQDGNGRVGRLIMLKECLRHNIVPIMIDDELKMFYYRGLSKYKEETGFLRDTCLAGQDKVQKWLDYFEIESE